VEGKFAGWWAFRNRSQRARRRLEDAPAANDARDQLPEFSRANADDRLPLASRGRVEGGDGIVEGRDVADVGAQASVPHPLHDLTQWARSDSTTKSIARPSAGRASGGPTMDTSVPPARIKPADRFPMSPPMTSNTRSTPSIGHSRFRVLDTTRRLTPGACESARAPSVPGARGVAWLATTTTTSAAASAMFVVKRVPFDTPFLRQGAVNVPTVLSRGIPVDRHARRCRRLGEVVEASSGCSLLSKAEPGLLGGCPDIADS
jgi:hypothetical protein